MTAVVLQSADRLLEATPSVPEEARLTVPDVRVGSVSRTALVNRIRGEGAPVVALAAPAGYGKTTVLAQWAGRDERPFAWLSIADEDDDPLSLCANVAAALGRVAVIDPAILDSLACRRSSSTAIRTVAAVLSSPAEPFILVLDDVHRLRSRGCVDAVAAFADRIPAGSTLVLAGRGLPRIPRARLKIVGRLSEFRTAELALSRREIEVLVRGLDLELGGAELTELEEQTEGWAAGVHLAALRLQEEPATRGERGTVDRFLADYLDTEHLSGLGPDDRRFLIRTSVLETMCGPLCDAVLEAEASARKLAAIGRSNLFLVPVDGQGEWYRYHRQFRAVLRAELERQEPGLVPALNARAAAWCQANGEPEAAIAYAHAAGDVDLLARLVAAHALPAWSAGNSAKVETWLGWFDDHELASYPAVAVLGAWVHALRGRTATAERWLDLAAGSAIDEVPPDGSASIRPWIAVVRAALCREGPERMRADAEYALRELGPASRWRPTALLLRGAAEVLLGESDRAEASMADTAEAAESVGATPTRIAALAEQALLVENRGDHERAESLTIQARELVDEHRLSGYVRSAIAFAASARRHLRGGNVEHARADLEQARALRPQLTHALPWYSVYTSVELAHVELALLDVHGARAWLSHADEIVRRRPDLGVLADRLKDCGVEVERVDKAQEERVSSLTAAEVRLLPFLATHLSFREIGEHLYVSRNTVKTQAISVYRKLGVSSRSEAIERAVELGLVEAAPAVSVDFIRTG